MTTEEKVKNLIECNCDEAYKSRGLSAPDCPQCNYAEDVIELIKQIAVGFLMWDEGVNNPTDIDKQMYGAMYIEFINQQIESNENRR